MNARLISASICCAGVCWCLSTLHAAERPLISSYERHGDSIALRVNLPSGLRHAVLEAREGVGTADSEALIAGALDGGEAVATFHVPLGEGMQFLTLRAGEEPDPPPSRYSGPAYFSTTSLSTMPLSTEQRLGHVLNRLGYGPSPAGRARVAEAGVGAYVEEQLHPTRIDETDNLRLQEAEAALFEVFQPHLDTVLVQPGEAWRYFKGTTAPPSIWREPDFDDSSWLEGPAGIGYGDGDDATVLDDMRATADQPGYPSVFLRRTFNISDPDALDQLILRVDYDDGYVAYLNGVEVARANLDGNPPPHDATTTDSREAGSPDEIDLTAQVGLVQPGANVLAFQVHNYDLTSSDLSLIPTLLSRTILPVDPVVRIGGVNELQQLIHVRGVYSRRQLQAALAEFWENHFTTDYDKVVDYLDDLDNSDGTDAMGRDQAEAEAAQAEYEEYQFFYDHALGQFGDLLLYSATSPAMLIYLDNVLNQRGSPNENYAREILELFAFGVDNRYTQADIEELARCFTGWTLRKVATQERPAFPESARNPLTQPAVQFEDEVLLDLGPGWTYFKGQSEPSPAAGGTPGLNWTQPDFDDSAWLSGSTGFGYADGDDATVLDDMRNSYGSIYLRREFTLEDRESWEGLLLSVAYDDGFVAYLNGVEVARSETLENVGTPPPFNAFATGNHEASQPEDAYYLTNPLELIPLAPEFNVLAIHVYNVTLNSSDLSMRPRILQRRPLPGSIENGDPNGGWVFRFNPDEHDAGPKQLFPGTAYALTVPEGRVGAEGVLDATEVIDAMISHPSTREFICLKLINRLVSDDISLTSYHNGTAPDPLKTLMDDALAAWMSTTPPGNIETVLRAILRPDTQDGTFWSEIAYHSKVKTPVEFINSSLRALDAEATGTTLPSANAALGMELFTRDDPDGWSELGFDWVDTGSLLARIQFLQRLAANNTPSVTWDLDALAASLPDPSATGWIDYFDALLYEGNLPVERRELLLRFASTNDQGEPTPLDPARADYRRRVQDLVALILALPEFHLQ